MKKILQFLCLSGLLLTFSVGYAQQMKQVSSKIGIHDQLDTRVDNMQYWMKMAAKGYTPYNPNIPLAPAIFNGSQISAHGVRTTDSPDVPVTNLTNVTESENSVFVDPNNADYLLNSNNSTSWSGGSVGSIYGANYFQSSNAGIGWVGSPNGAGGSNSGDPTTAIGLNGREYVNFISNPGGQGIAFSDNGTTWTTATIAPSPGDLADKNHMWIDNKTTSSQEGNLYTAWTDFGGADDSQIKISRSVNDGVTWSTGINISTATSAGSHNQGVNIKTGPNGEVYVAWAVYDSWPSDETAIGFAKSTNGGVSYAPATRILSNIKGIRTTAVLKNHRVNSFPVMAVDISGGVNNGNIYIVWTNVGVPGTNTGTNKSVYIIRSTNGGTSWSTPVRVNQGPNTAGKEAYFPWISCDPETGVLSVVFYDDRNVSSTQCEVFSAYSTDAGNTWTDFKVSDVSFTPAAIPGLAGGYMGDYLGITSKGGKIYPCWTDNRGGVYMTYVSPYQLGLNAGFTTTTTTICTGTGVTFTDVSTGPPTSWTWSFPGGTPSSFIGQNPPTITYNTPGTYDVSLTVSDGVTSDTETKTGYITVKSVIADFTGTPTTVVVGNSVTFTNNSSCNPTTWVWSFPGGTPSSFNGQTPPAITYNTLGTYDVSLTVTKPGGTDTKTRVGYITVSPPVFNITNGTITTCTGDFYDTGGPTGPYQNNETIIETFLPSTPSSMLRFTFSSFNTESGYDTLTIYNGSNTSAPIIGKYHGTTSPGIVTASNSTGALTFRFHSDVSLTYDGWAAAITCYSTTIPPVADFSASTVNPTIAQTVTFTDLSTNFPTSWAWSFNPSTVTYVGGTNASSQNPQVQFNVLGAYTVTLTATNAYGSDSEIKTNYINVINCTFNTLPFNESFSTTSIPTCWSQVDHIGAGKIWQFGVITTAPAPVLTGNYAFLNSDAYGSGVTENADLISPLLNLSGYTNVNLQFSHYFLSYTGTSGTLSYSINGGTTWTQIQQFTTTTANPATFNQVIAAVSNQAQVKFKWNYTGTYGYWWAVDNVSITGTSTGPTLAVSPPNQNVTTPAGSTTFNVVSNSSWTVLSDQTWCTVNPSGTGNGTITANYTQNTLPAGRVANITVTVSGLSPVVVTVTQAGTLIPTLAVTPSNMNVSASAGTTPFSVTSNSSWTVVSDQTWCTVTPSGTGNGTITATYAQNLLTIPRVANITVTVVGLAPVIVTVSQAGAAPTLSVTPSNQNVTAPGGFVTFNVTSNLTWTIASNMTWCVPSPGSGSGNGSFDVIYEENTAMSSRVATLTITVTGLSPVTVTVTQAAASPTLNVTPINQNVSAPAGSTSFAVTTNSSWTASCAQGWCSVTPSGTGNGTLSASYQENASNVERVATITVLVNGIGPVVVTVTQAGSSPTLNVTPAIQYVTVAAGTTNFSVTSNSSWTAASNAVSWCTVTPSGTGNGTVVATYSKNTSQSPRQAIISVSVAGLNPVNVTVSQEGMVGISEIQQRNLILYPNPNDGKFTISTRDHSITAMTVRITDIQGKEIKTIECNGKERYSFDLSGQAKGNYLVRITTGETSFVRKVIVE